jgi:ABC-type oligopeptide transport system substrate-binding subunit
VDREVLVGKVRGLGEQPWHSVLPPGIPGYPALRKPGDSAAAMAQRIDTARNLVRQSIGSARLRLGIGFPTSPTGRKMYLAVAAMWKPIGVDLELLPLDGRAYSAALQRGDYDLFSYAAFAVVPSASNFLLRFVSDSAENVTRYRNVAFDRAVTAAERQLTLAARYAGYGEAETLLLRDVPLIPLWAGNSHRLIARRVRGWVDHPGHAHQSRYLSLAG